MSIPRITKAMDYIDDDLVSGAVDYKRTKKKKKSLPVWVKWGAMAACLCLVITASIMIMPNVLNTEIENYDKVSMQGTVVDSSIGKLALTDNNLAERKCTFTLTKTNDEPIYFCFRGYSVLNTYLDENGIQRKEVQQYHIITPYDQYNEAATNHIVFDDKLIITVNGELVDTIPAAQGTYEITIDYSALYEFLDYVEPAVDVYSFGSFEFSDEFDKGV